MNDAPTSPRLRKLLLDISNAGDDALEAFWRDVTSNGTPLVEPIGQNRLLVTFLWGGAESTVAVIVEGGLSGSSLDRLEHLPNTDIWFRSYESDNDLRTTYDLLPDVPLADLTGDEAVVRKRLGNVPDWRVLKFRDFDR